MNMFKVMASGRKSFPEECASALLAWLLNPNMEHGLGYCLLGAFVEAVAQKAPTEEARRSLFHIKDKLKPNLRSQQGESLKLEMHLEKNVGNAFIDIVIQLDDWWFSIENKLYGKSLHQNKNQLKTQYAGLRQLLDNSEMKGQHIASIFLVPETSSAGIYDEYEALDRIEPSDYSLIVTWQTEEDTPDRWPSVTQLIRSVLEQEQEGKIEPITEYIRHTLKALIVFIENGFDGYKYSTPPGTTGINPKTTEHVPWEDLLNKNDGYVGVKYGLIGLLRMTTNRLSTQRFQFSEYDMSRESFWIPIDVFKKVAKWMIQGTVEPIMWEYKLPSDVLFKIASSYGGDVFIGIKGGQESLSQMLHEDIAKKRWQISTKKHTSQWIEGTEFIAILKGKGF